MLSGMLSGTDAIVVGAGVIGLTTAIRLAEAGRRVAVWTAELPPATTSAVAGAMCGPPVPYGDERLDRWSATCAARFTELAETEGTGVRLTRGRLVTSLGDEVPAWARQLAGYAPCTELETAGFPVAFWVEVPTVDMPVYLGYLADRLAAAGGSIGVRRVSGLDEPAAEAPVVVNCTGTGARDLVPDDGVRAVKGQHVIVANPGLDTFLYERSMTGMWAGFFPYGDHVVLGGIAVEDDWDRTPDPDVTAGILDRCAKVEPRLAGAEVLRVEVGLRPFRDTPRLEAEKIGEAVCVHNYGHAGTGVSWSWGAADDVLALLDSTGWACGL
jgi:D-amino-acid oxidase